MNALYFKAAPETYAQIQPEIDAAFYDGWIANGKCEHILPPAGEMPVREDGFCYLAVPLWMLEVVGADAFLSWPGIVEISEAEFLASATEGVGT